MLRGLAAFALVMLAAACAVTSQPFPSLESLPAAFEVSGRLGIRLPGRSDIAALRWTRTASGDVWVIASPLGNEVARIESSARGAKLSRAGGESEEAPSFQALTERVLGVALDPQLLARWLHGETPRETGGWQVTIDEKQHAGAIDLARIITATRDDVRVRLVIAEYRPLDR